MYDVLSIRGQLKLLVYYTVMRTHTQLTIIIQIESYTNKYPTSPHAKGGDFRTVGEMAQEAMGWCTSCSV